MRERCVSHLCQGNITAFSLLSCLLVWPQPVSFQSTSVPSGVFPSFRFPQALRASVPSERSQMLSLVSGPWRWLPRAHSPGTQGSRSGSAQPCRGTPAPCPPGFPRKMWGQVFPLCRKVGPTNCIRAGGVPGHTCALSETGSLPTHSHSGLLLTAVPFTVLLSEVCLL